MYAPVGECWTLALCCWWGGWAPGESQNTLMHYLLDELQTYEEDYSDILAPIHHGQCESLVGEA
ncbi:hypothetical protein BS47DRAFT_1255258, partial [Hydnum rufescens UP504]